MKDDRRLARWINFPSWAGRAAVAMIVLTLASSCRRHETESTVKAGAAPKDVDTQPVIVSVVPFTPVNAIKTVGSARSTTVIVDLLVNEEGQACAIQLSLDPGIFDEEKALATVRKWRFKPGRRNGLPTVARITVPLNILLRK